MNVVLVAALLAASAQGRIAVLQMQGTKVTGDEALRITELVHVKTAAAAKSTGLKVIGSSELAAALEQAGIDAAHCEDECVADAGKAAKADFVLSGRATKLKNKTTMLLMMHTGDGVLVASTQVRPDGDDDLPNAIEKACNELVAAAAKRAPAQQPKQPPAVAQQQTPPPAPPPSKPAPTVTRAPAAAVEASTETTPSRTPYIAVGALALAGGLAMDLAPDGAHDHKLSGSDFIPVALYAVGVAVIAWGLTR